ncbi:TKL protein kinase [Phytophthora cinnamomi]|uniref:TKL protein kinase n=1 Tax=Phytophthora cinnamomi TaxID=4785 RepID=UPI003559C7A8|nr:TKL protein kinase [Phytophthora cinnamomi]
MDFTYDTAAASAYVSPAVLQSDGILTRRLADLASVESSVTSVTSVSSCVADPNCTTEVYSGHTYYTKSECITDPYSYSVDSFSGGSGGLLQPFLMIETYTGEECGTLSTINATATADGCQFASENSSSSATLFTNGSALYQLYDHGACGGDATRYFVNRSTLLNHTCYEGNTKFYTNYDASTGSSSASGIESASGSTSSTADTSASVFGGAITTPSPTSTTITSSHSGLTAGGIVGVTIGAVALIFFIAALIRII